MSMNKRLIAINLPQFHPFKENDEWWGKGFTEWTNVVNARPRFRGHYQPQLPTDTGFYDLRLPESRQMQANMAKQYGIYGFCYYHYWFNGKQLMERPVNDILSSGKPDFPFMICWANENWTRSWNGEQENVLIKQNYSEEDDIAHIDYLCKNYFSDPRYIRVHRKPFFVVYRPDLIPNIKNTIEIWRRTAQQNGFNLYLGFMRAEKNSREFYIDAGFDVSIDFQPNFITDKKWWLDYRAWIDAMRFKLFRRKKPIMPVLYDYAKYVKYACSHALHNYKNFPCIFPGWDNSPRRANKSFTAIIRSTPNKYGEWLRFLLDNFKPYSDEENFIFINAWNEWAEGNHLEPDQKWGRAYLDETKKQLDI